MGKEWTGKEKDGEREEVREGQMRAGGEGRREIQVGKR